MTGLASELEEAQARVARIKHQMAQATCVQIGRHDLKHIGGCNAGCDLGDDCCCSVPVHECQRCGDCNYGQNAEAVEVRARCKARRA